MFESADISSIFKVLAKRLASGPAMAVAHQYNGQIRLKIDVKMYREQLKKQH